MVGTRRSSNHIHYFIDHTWRRLDSVPEIQATCVEYFKDLFVVESSQTCPNQSALIHTLTTFRCDEDQRNILRATVSAEDIKREVFALPKNKYPGPDGYTGEFFKKTWGIIGNDFTLAVHEFFNSGQILKQWIATSITIAPKTPGAGRLSDFMPISCCNIAYKVISKILARRLQQILPSISRNANMLL